MAAACAAALAWGAQAQSPAPLETAACLSFDEALTLSARGDPAAAVARAELLEAEGRLQEARSLRFPQISSFARTGLGDNGLVDTQIENQFGLRASQRVIDFGDSRLAREAAREEVGAQESFVLSAEGQAALQTGLAYLAWLQAEAELSATEARIDFFSRQLAAVEALLEQGGSTRADQAEIAAELAGAEAARFDVRFERDRAAAAIAIATGRDAPLCPGDASAAAAYAPRLEAVDAADRLVEEAIDANPEIRALRRSAAGLEAAAERERRARLPVIDVVGIASFASDNDLDDFDFQNRVGVDLSVPLFTGFGLAGRARQAEARAARSDGELTAALRRLREDLAVGVRRAFLLEAQILRRQDVVDARAAQFDAAEIEFDRGVRTLPDLIDARIDLETAHLALITATYAKARQNLQLAALAGRLYEAEQGVDAE